MMSHKRRNVKGNAGLRTALLEDAEYIYQR